jgi:hypothetical protein
MSLFGVYGDDGERVREPKDIALRETVGGDD